MYILLALMFVSIFLFTPLIYFFFGIGVAVTEVVLCSICVVWIIVIITFKKSGLVQNRNKMTKNILKSAISENFKSMYKYVYDNYGASLEKYRKNILLHTLISVFLMFLTGILYFIIMIKFEIMSKFSRETLLYIFIPSLIYMVYTDLKYSRKYQKEFKEKVVKNFIEIMPYQLSYSNVENNTLQKYYDDAKFTDVKYENFVSNDYLEGFVNDINIQISDVVLEKDVFKGIFSVSLISQILPEEVRIKTKRYINKYEKEKVEVDNDIFAKYFDVFSKSKVLALEILTHDVMEEMVQYFETNKINFEIVMKENRIYIRYNIGDIFEGEVLRKSTNIKSLWIFYNMTRFTIELAVKMNTILEEKEI